jgi:hypothetical protein
VRWNSRFLGSPASAWRCHFEFPTICLTIFVSHFWHLELQKQIIALNFWSAIEHCTCRKPSPLSSDFDLSVFSFDLPLQSIHRYQDHARLCVNWLQRGPVVLWASVIGTLTIDRKSWWIVYPMWMGCFIKCTWTPLSAHAWGWQCRHLSSFPVAHNEGFTPPNRAYKSRTIAWLSCWIAWTAGLIRSLWLHEDYGPMPLTCHLWYRASIHFESSLRKQRLTRRVSVNEFGSCFL